MKRAAALLLYVLVAGGGWLYHQLEMRDAEREIAAANAALSNASDQINMWWRRLGDCQAGG